MGNVATGSRVVQIVDTVAPVIEVKTRKDNNGLDYTIGTEPYYSRVSFKLYDNVSLKEFEVNGNVFKLTENKWSDANFGAFKKYLVEGENTIIVRDTSGNETSLTFTYDKTAPTIEVKYGSKDGDTTVGSEEGKR